MHREPDVGFDPGSPVSRPGPKASAKPLRHPGIPGPQSIFEQTIVENFPNLGRETSIQIQELEIPPHPNQYKPFNTSHLIVKLANFKD